MKFFFIGLVIGAVVLLLLISSGLTSKTEQPISFNHKKHMEQGLECNTCHPYFKEQTFSGMPTVATCLECHKDPITKGAEEEKIRQFHQTGKEIPWKRLYEQPDDVFFSHRRHVALGKIGCQTCHGDVGQSEKPPSKPWMKMTMKWCMDCHAKTKASNDCLACHV
ncbi:MAG: cytochrome c3 family protein [Thermodesulfobacteriota bacterium]